MLGGDQFPFPLTALADPQFPRDKVPDHLSVFSPSTLTGWVSHNLALEAANFSIFSLFTMSCLYTSVQAFPPPRYAIPFKVHF